MWGGRSDLRPLPVTMMRWGRIVRALDLLRRSRILRGEESALARLFPQEEDKQHLSAEVYYQNHPARKEIGDSTEAKMLSLLHQSHALNQHTPGKICRVLEVGCGTGSLTQCLLQWLRQSWADKFELYFTDISQSFFIKAEKKFEEFKENIKFAVFNIEQSPLSQGIPLDYFDVVCATDVLHATRNLEETLVHLRQTLKPGGVLCFTETVIPARDITFVFGLLEGYWRFEDKMWRPEHCCVGVEVWKQLLEKCGFCRTNWVKNYVDQFACVMAVADENVEVDRLTAERAIDEEKEEIRRWLVFGDRENLEVTSKVANMLDASGFRVELVWRGDRVPREEDQSRCLKVGIGRRCVKMEREEEIRAVLEEGIQGIVYAWGMDLDETGQSKVALPFLNVCKALVQIEKLPRLLVVTRGVSAVNEDAGFVNPNAATLWGMVKSLKNETDMSVRCVDLEGEADTGKLVKQVLFELAMHKGPKEQQRLQVAYRGGVRYEPRLVKATLPTPGDLLKLPPSTDRFHLKLPDTRVIQDLEFEPLDQVEALRENEVEVKIKAFALNFRDIFAILKPSKEFERLNGVGLDFAGVVVKAGKEAKWKVGERVFGANFKDGQLPSHLAIDSFAVLRIPDAMTYEEAATLPAVFLTAYHCLINVAGMKKGDKVLIHTGSGGVGLAAIQLAKQVGAEIITTAGNPRKRAYLRGLGIQHVFRSRDTSYEQDILRVTNGQGVDLVLNSITGPGIKEATLRATARNGRFVEMSKLNTWTPEEVKAMRPDVDYNIVDLTVVDRETSANLMKRLSEYLAEGQLKPIPYTKFDALSIRQALQYFQKAKHIGKVVVSMPEVSTQQGQYKTEVPLFNGESTYLITGGLNGIGFEVCQWMIGLGATDFVLTARSAPKPEVAERIKKLNETGNNVMIRLGDVGDYTHCKAMIQEINASMKPLRGVMHCAGVLRDNLYANQTWSDFEATYNPKIRGTWNLHQLTQNCPLEHFVVYSSLTALVGTPAQPNHSSANCFEDALIHLRHSMGLPGTTINWGQWAQVGCAKEISLPGLLPVSMQRMLNGMEVALRAQKRQVSFSEFEALANFCVLCPSFRHYLDDRLWKQCSNQGQGAQGTVNGEQFWQDMAQVETKAEKIAVLCTYLKVILRQALRLEPDEPISEDANIQEMGVDSLMMIELKNSMQALFGSRQVISANSLKNCTTLKMLATAVIGNLMEGEEEEIVPLEPLPDSELMSLLKKDAELPEEIKIAPEVKGQVKVGEIRRVLVTGATGQLGPYMLAKLSQLKMDKIWVLVRGEDEAKAREKLKAKLEELELTEQVDLNKVECVAGNVAKDKLGLAEEKYKQLSLEVEAVIHYAAKTHPSEHFGSSRKFTDIRSVNVGGTLNLLRFCCLGKVKHLMYPSSLVSGIFGGTTQEKGRLSDEWPGADVIDTMVNNKVPGLQSSKWICEMLLKQANDRGIPCKVFRFPWIGGESKTGRVDVLSNLCILRFLSFMKLGAMPDVVIPANVLPVDICADVALNLFFNENAPNEIFNVGHPKPEIEQEFVRMVKDEFNKPIEILDRQEFASRVKGESEQADASLKQLLSNQQLVSYYISDAAEYVTGYVSNPDGFFKNEKTERFVKDYGKDFPSTMDVLRRNLRYLKEKGLLAKFGI